MILPVDSNRLRFYLFRIKRASFFEIVHRAQERFFLSRLAKNPDHCKHCGPSSYPEKASFQLLVFPAIAGTVSSETLKLLLDGHVATLNQGHEAIKQSEGKWLEYFFHKVRQAENEPDIRGVWEPARLQHLMLLLQHLEYGDAVEKQSETAEHVRLQLLEWLESNPFLYGPHYISVMECGLRIPVFLRALLVLDNLNSEEQEKLCTAMYQHGWLIRKRLSLYASLGNHTVAESVGLVMAGAVFQELECGREWLAKGIALLEQECRHQILDDGGPAEQSFAYHRFVLDLYWLAIGFPAKNGLYDCRAMQERVVLGEGFLSAMQHKEESMICVGDSDDGYAVAPEVSPQKDVDLHFPVRDVAVFPDSGYTVLRNEDGVRILFDHGRLGMEPLNNHGHADALAVFLSVKGMDFFIDPGTF